MSYTVNHLLLGVQAKFVDCACDLEIAHVCYAISRLPAQSQDSENVQHSLERDDGKMGGRWRGGWRTAQNV